MEPVRRGTCSGDWRAYSTKRAMPPSRKTCPMMEPQRDVHLAVWDHIVGQVVSGRVQWGMEAGVEGEEQEFLRQGRFFAAAEWVKENRQRLVFQAPGPGAGMFGKINFYQGWRDVLKGLFRNKAKEEIQTNRTFLGQGIPVVEPLAWCRGNGFDMVFTRAFSGSVDLMDVIWRQGNADVFRELCELARLLLEHRVSWSDFHIRNILAKPRGEGWELRLVDVYGARLETQMSRAARRRMVLRFFSGLGEAGGEELFGMIERHLGKAGIPEEEIRAFLAGRAGGETPR